ncbi:MAG TPA: hypothetical protein VJ813_11820, partial [Vicinamibacterales bacterium]|nr:hypothetical protein [Vicinamibacterales bacterium]
MEQRRLRLGDILDDYCPRERRVTNHAVVAMVEEDVKQTRCTTCDAEHVYKGGKAPRRRKKDAGVVLFEEVLAGMPETSESKVLHTATAEVQPMAQSNGDGSDDPVALPEGQAAAEEPAGEEPPAPPEDGPFHRRLIRATLPRPEGQKEVRQVPDFTIRHNGGRGPGHNPFRGDRSKMRGGAPGAGNGNRPQGGGGRRFSGG